MRHTLRLTALSLVAMGLFACGGNPPPPEGPSPEAVADSLRALEEARRDSIARADSIREARERRRIAEANRICERAQAAMAAGDYETARTLYRRAMREYAGTPCAALAEEGIAQIDDVRLIRERVHFEFDRSRITDEAAQVLRRKVEALRRHPNLRISIEGHCDERGSNEYNMALGQRRAESAKSYLVDLGVPEEMFETVSYGEERPVALESNEEAWAMNRRSEFVIRDIGQL